MNKDRFQLFRCEEMNWESFKDSCVEQSAQQSGQGSTIEKPSEFQTEDLIKLEIHVFVDGCEDCGQKAASIAKECKVIYQSPEKPNEG